MPYLQFIFCDKCQNVNMDIDYEGTIRAYASDGRTEKEVYINPATLIWDYLVYRCPVCGKQEKYTFRDIELKVRNYFSAMQKKYKDYFDQVDQIDFENMRRARPGARAARPETSKRITRLYERKD